MKFKSGLGAMGLLAALVAAPAEAAVVRVDGQIDNILASDGFAGGCAAQLSVDLSAEGLDCRDRWVILNCDADTEAERQDGRRMFDSALLAFSLGKQVKVWVDDGAKIDSYCYGNRVDVLRN